MLQRTSCKHSEKQQHSLDSLSHRRLGMTEIEPFVVVVGATGQQGGACVEALLQQNKFKVKALTRNSTSAAAKALAARDVTLVTGDLKDKDSLIKVCSVGGLCVSRKA